MCRIAAPALDEVKAYLDGRSLGAHEALWDIFGFHKHHKHHEHPKVERLVVHLEHAQVVYFNPAIAPAALQEQNTTLLHGLR